jgi:mRNA-degrading endonuclease RelE of RelBE toxin-antitoxin system
MPTFETDREFVRDWHRLTPEQQRRFKAAVCRFVEDLKAGRPPRRGLGIARFEGHEGVYEFHWASTGRPTGGRCLPTARRPIPAMST